MTLSTHRRLARRKRAKARRNWWLYRKGYIQLTALQLKHLKALLAPHHSKDSSFLQLIQSAMDADWNGPWKCSSCGKTNGKKAAFCDRCGDTWDNGTPHDTQQKSGTVSNGWTYSRWKDWKSSANQNWEESSASSRSLSRRQPIHQNQTNRRKKKRGQPKVPAPPPKGRGKGTKAAGRDGQQHSPPLPPPPAPPPWPTLDSAALLANNTNTVPPTDPNTLAVTQQLQADNREFARLLRDAYPDVQSRPPEAAAAIDRAEQGMKKSVTKSLHVATTALDKAQKLLTETAEARRIHRNSWLAHLTESIKTWESQLETYRKHGAALHEVAQKARADIAAARADIQRLSTQEPGDSSALAAATITVAEEGQTEDQADADEERLRAQLQGVLQTCASSLGMSAAFTPDVQTIISDEERDVERGNNKRPRSVEPGAGAPSS